MDAYILHKMFGVAREKGSIEKYTSLYKFLWFWVLGFVNTVIETLSKTFSYRYFHI